MLLAFARPQSSYDRPSSFATVQNPFSTARNEARSVPASALSSRREKEEEPVEIVAVSGGGEMEEIR